MRFIGKFIVRGLLGRGGMAVVYKVKLPGLGRLAALKLLKPKPELLALLGEAELKRRFVSEARVMASMQHPNLASVWDLGESEAGLYYLMDYHCRDVARLIGEGPRLEDPSRVLETERALDITRQCLKGLERLHEAGIVHRDIKPGNLLVSQEGRVKICDFGLAKLPGHEYAEPANLLVGSPYYTAPEQEADPNAADRRADLFSVGVLLLRLMSGQLTLEDPPGPAPSGLDLDPAWREFFERSTASDPGLRFQSAPEMLSALDRLEAAWLREKPSVCRWAETESPEIEPQKRTRRRSTPIKAAGAQGRGLFGLDSLWRPLRYNPGDFKAMGHELIEDPALSLCWERSGSRYPLSWAQALRRIYDLNEQAFGGRSDWRIPTIDELITLLRPPPSAKGFCLELPFDPTQDWLWSADRHTFTSAWLVSLEDGFVGWQDNSCRFHLRAVASNEPA